VQFCPLQKFALNSFDDTAGILLTTIFDGVLYILFTSDKENDHFLYTNKEGIIKPDNGFGFRL